jgi:hypothetical protein
MYTFRTMVPEAERLQTEVIIETEAAQVVHKRRDDPRLTRAGQFLRRYSLDELPQLANVLQGTMSLVGLRSEMPWLVDKYEPWQRKRFAVPQGMTGWWQINGRSDKPKHLNTDGDLYCGYTYSLSLSLWILLQTPLAALKGTGLFQGWLPRRACTDLGWGILSHRQEPRFLTRPVPPIHTDSPRTCGCGQVSPDSLTAVKDALSSAG